MDFDRYLEDLASAAPTPGGGSAAAIVVALAAALVAMVARITRENPAYGAVAELADDLIAHADRARAEAREAGLRDEAAYGAVVVAMALAKAEPLAKAARASAVQRALAGAAAAPLATAALARDVVTLTERALTLRNVHLASDLGCAAEFAGSGLAAAAWNVRVNHKFMKDPATVGHQETELAGYETAVAPLLRRLRSDVARSIAR